MNEPPAGRPLLGYGPKGIRVNGTRPAYAKTALTRDLYATTDFMHAFAESVPLKRWDEMRDIAHLTLYLAGDESGRVRCPLIRTDGRETPCR
ncbi:SDR family oxidoreductase [Streptosporangium subroseum]|uniref:SDR family oxidoreductase n=1 Tax=Streptosporangium subroseum TaxID=106412 RepID=UPI00343D62DC